MRLQHSFILLTSSLIITTTVAVPFVDSNLETFPNLSLESRDPSPKWPPRSPTPTHSSSNCPTQGPIASNVCSSGSPYCCSGSGKSMVCGPASTTQCTTTTICCINTNGVSSSPESCCWGCETDFYWNADADMRWGD
jgi:hypothetical protein